MNTAVRADCKGMVRWNVRWSLAYTHPLCGSMLPSLRDRQVPREDAGQIPARFQIWRYCVEEDDVAGNGCGRAAECGSGPTRYASRRRTHHAYEQRPLHPGENPGPVIDSVREVVGATRKKACVIGARSHGQCVMTEKHAHHS